MPTEYEYSLRHGTEDEEAWIEEQIMRYYVDAIIDELREGGHEAAI